MNSLNGKPMQVIAASIDELQLPELTNGDPDDKSDAFFTVSSADGKLMIVGTFDDIVKFASDLIVKMYSWPVITGHVDWLSPDTVAAVLEGEIPHGTEGD